MNITFCRICKLILIGICFFIFYIDQTLIEALENALECSVNMIDKYFDKVTYSLSDSDDDDDEADSHKRYLISHVKFVNFFFLL